VKASRSIVIAHDLAMVVLAWGLAFLARFNFEVPPDYALRGALHALPAVVLMQGLLLWRVGLYRGLWRFASLRDLWNIVRSAGMGALFISLALFIASRLEGVPRAVLILYPVFLILLLGAPRLFYRVMKDGALSLRHITGGTRVLIVGAGNSGETLLRDMLRDAQYLPVGFVDDRADLLRRRIHGVPVLGNMDDLPDLVARYRADLVVIAIPSASNAQMQRIVEICGRAACPFRTLPRLQDIVSGRLGLQEIRQVSIDDLLGRSVTRLDWAGLQDRLTGKTVLVTGGAGSIGSELCRQAARLGAGRLIVLEQNEHGLYQLERELRVAHPHLPCEFLLGDVCDEAAVEAVFSRCRPQVIFHAAAYKHVPIVELQVREGVRNNVLGTRTVALAAVRHNADTMVLISTDKAVRPSSAMGATKRMAELVCELANLTAETHFITVRFGNVLGSAGSVVPLFQEQIRSGGPVTVTHPEATRYFMTIPEAAQLILQAAALGRGGEIFVLEMGQPVNIAYLAEQMIRLSGHLPNEDIRIVFTGLRPGEKLHEELFNEDEALAPTAHGKVMQAVQAPVDVAAVQSVLRDLEAACARGAANEELLAHLRRAVPEFNTPEPGELATSGKVMPFKRGFS